MTFSGMTFSRMKLSGMTFSIMTFSIMTFSRMIFIRITNRIMTLSITPLRIAEINILLSVETWACLMSLCRVSFCWLSWLQKNDADMNETKILGFDMQTTVGPFKLFLPPTLQFWHNKLERLTLTKNFQPSLIFEGKAMRRPDWVELTGTPIRKIGLGH